MLTYPMVGVACRHLFGEVVLETLARGFFDLLETSDSPLSIGDGAHERELISPIARYQQWIVSTEAAVPFVLDPPTSVRALFLARIREEGHSRGFDSQPTAPRELLGPGTWAVGVYLFELNDYALWIFDGAEAEAAAHRLFCAYRSEIRRQRFSF